jgi:microcystin-dependent protein
MSIEPYIGQISMVGFNFPPKGWAFCDGQLMSIAQNTALFSLLGTTYGGDGKTTFGLPDLRGRVPVHQGQGPGLSPYVLGQQGGSETVTLNISTMPAHNHTVSPPANNAPLNTTVYDPTNAYPGAQDSQSGIALYASQPTASTVMGPSQTSVSGSSQPHENRQPFLCISFIIALQGIFPSRN